MRASIAATPTDYEGKSLAVTVSLGVAQYDRSRDVSGKSLIDRADQALYVSKQDRPQPRDRGGLGGMAQDRSRIAGRRRLQADLDGEPGGVAPQLAPRGRSRHTARLRGQGPLRNLRGARIVDGADGLSPVAAPRGRAARGAGAARRLPPRLPGAGPRATSTIEITAIEDDGVGGRG